MKDLIFANRNLLLSYKNTRHMIKYIRDNHKSNPGLTGAEIGVRKADNAINILDNLTMKQLYLIDSFKNYKGYGDWVDDSWESITRKRIKKYRGKTILIKDFSCNAVKQFQDKFFDFVYIDANHDYKFIKQDIELWHPKIKNNGILGGHDFNRFPLLHNGIYRAVIEFVNKEGLDLNFYGNDWWIINEEK